METKRTRAIRYAEYGDPSVLKMEELPRPEPQEGQVLVRIRATGVHPMDWKTRAGYLRDFMPVELPHTPGLEFSGTVEQVGDGVTGFDVGDAVFGWGSGTYAEYAIAPVATIAHKPDGVSFEQAAPLGLTGVTAWQAVEAVELEAGQRVLIHGGAGGVGSLAVQLAKRGGAQVIATASTENVDFVKSIGADEVLDYTAGPFETKVRDVDAVIDTVGGDVIDRSYGVLKRGGILLTIAGQPDAAMAEERGVRLGAREMHGATTSVLEQLGQLATSGAIRVPVAAVFPWERAAEAHAAAQTGHGHGRRVLVID
jgi:NADPH:quinone reductase-like Zn-dependent oxidoreductase